MSPFFSFFFTAMGGLGFMEHWKNDRPVVAHGTNLQDRLSQNYERTLTIQMGQSYPSSAPELQVLTVTKVL